MLIFGNILQHLSKLMQTAFLLKSMFANKQINVSYRNTSRNIYYTRVFQIYSSVQAAVYAYFGSNIQAYYKRCSKIQLSCFFTAVAQEIRIKMLILNDKTLTYLQFKIP